MNIYVSNIAFNATTQDLRQLFESYGVVDKINIITDRDTGQSRGFGFVEMPDSAAAKAAIQGLQGKELAGRTLTVNEAKPTGLAGVTIGNDIDLVHGTIRFEELAEILSRSIERNIAHINVHAKFLW